MNYELAILLFIVFLAGGLFVLPKIVNFFLLRKLPDLPEIERKLHEGKYGAFDAARAQYLIDYYITRGIYFSKYEEGDDNNGIED